MEYFIPRFPLDLPASSNPAVLNHTLTKIDRRDLPRIMDHWAKLDTLISDDDVEDEKAMNRHFRNSNKEVCVHPSEKQSLAPFLLNPHITVHSGARIGNEHISKVAIDTAYEIGRLVAENGFSFWYGGGESGLMGTTMRGFSDQLKVKRFPGQVSVQVSPAQFVVGVKNSVNGMKAVNEGLAENTDVAIVTPNFIVRRHLLDTALTRYDAAITVVGAEGSLDEWADIATHVKTGLLNTKLYGINPQVPSLDAKGAAIPGQFEGFWDGLQKQRETFVKYGLGTQKSLDAMPFMQTPTMVFDDLTRHLKALDEEPQTIFKARLERYRARAFKTTGVAVTSDNPLDVYETLRKHRIEEEAARPVLRKPLQATSNEV